MGDSLRLLCCCHLWLNIPFWKQFWKWMLGFYHHDRLTAYSPLCQWLILAHLPYTLVSHCKYATSHAGIIPAIVFKLFKYFHKLQFFCCSQQVTAVSHFSSCHVELLQKQSLIYIFKCNFLTYRPWPVRRKITTGYWKRSELQGH